MKNVLVTGSTGFIGSHLVEKLIEQKIRVKCLVRKTSDLRWLNGLDVDYVYGDISIIESLKEAVKGVDTIFHVAGKTKANTEESFYTVNSAGTLNLLKAVSMHNPGIKRFIYISSIAAAGPATEGRPLKESDPASPISSYGASKLAGEDAVMAFSSKFPVTILRPSVVFGARDKDGLKMFKIVSKGFRPKLGFGNRFYSIIFVDELIDAIIMSAKKQKAAGEVIFLSSYPKVSMDDFTKALADALNKRAVCFFIPVTVAFVIALFSELYAFFKGHETIINRQKIIEMKQKLWLCDDSKQKEILGFSNTISLSEALHRSDKWYKEEGWM